jgi:hypothetical protein
MFKYWSKDIEKLIETFDYEAFLYEKADYESFGDNE